MHDHAHTYTHACMHAATPSKLTTRMWPMQFPSFPGRSQRCDRKTRTALIGVVANGNYNPFCCSAHWNNFIWGGGGRDLAAHQLHSDDSVHQYHQLSNEPMGKQEDTKLCKHPHSIFACVTQSPLLPSPCMGEELHVGPYCTGRTARIVFSSTSYPTVSLQKGLPDW